jgi:hypothetical protein
MSYKVIFKLLGVAIILLSIASCSSVKIHTDVDPSADFTKYKSFEYYGWADKSDQMLNDLDKRRIESAFADEFYKRGLGVVGKDGDLVIALHIVVQQKQQTTATTTSMGGGYGGYGGYYGYGPGYGWGTGYSTTQVNTYDYEVGTLIVSVYDKAKEQLIWESSGSGEINQNPKGRDKRIPVVVQKIMASYPVAPIEEEK